MTPGSRDVVKNNELLYVVYLVRPDIHKTHKMLAVTVVIRNN